MLDSDYPATVLDVAVWTHLHVDNVRGVFGVALADVCEQFHLDERLRPQRDCHCRRTCQSTRQLTCWWKRFLFRITFTATISPDL